MSEQIGKNATSGTPTGAMGSRLRIERVSLSELHADPANARKHSDRNLDAIGDSLASFGQVEPLVVQRGTGRVIGGNGRLAVMRRNGQTHADVVFVDVDDQAATRLGIALNRTAELAEWDKETLASLLDGMDESDLLTTGFDKDELTDLLKDLTPAEVVEDEAPEPLPDPVSKTGDLWALGDHRLLCGDSTKAADVGLVMGVERADVCLTDPPYGCGEAYASHDDTQENLDSLAQRFFPLAVKHAKVVAMTPGIENIRHYPHADWMLCWFYGVGTGRTPWGFTCWQPVCVWGKDPKLQTGNGCHPDGVNKLMSAEDMAINRELQHACPKPVSVWCWFLDRLTTEKGQSVYEPFSGSGTTIIAAEQLGRKCYAIEIEPRYVDVAVRRWEKLTGKSATLNGRTFAEVAAERGVSIV